MLPAINYLAARGLAAWGVAGRFLRTQLAMVAALHLAAFILMVWHEHDLVSKSAFVLTWGFLNFGWLVVLKRPAPAAALSLVMLVILTLLSQLKHDKLLVTVNFLDLLIIDADSFDFLMSVFPGLGRTVALSVFATALAIAAVWWLDPFRVRRRMAALGGTTCLAGLVALSFTHPGEQWEDFYGNNFVSKFARSATVAVVDLMTRGYLEADAETAQRFVLAEGLTSCRPARKPPHILMVFDESSFDIRAVAGVKVPNDYGGHFRSFDGRQRDFVVEGAGGPSWLTEYNVLTGLSVRSYGRFADLVTRIAAGRVERGLPQTLRRCGYKTFSLYPLFGAFLSARGFQTTTGIEHFIDAKDLGTNKLEPDQFYFDFARRLIARERGSAPLFLFIYTAANHFPWNYQFRPELLTGWQAPGNIGDFGKEIDEYLRRQVMSARDYREFVAQLGREFPGESFLVVRFGDHLPGFALNLFDPKVEEVAITKQQVLFDQRYYTTYYAIDAINFEPVDTSLALKTLDAPYLPLVTLEAAGLPLDPSFAEQKKILLRCSGLFYRCADGREARRFNRLLIDSGLIKGL